MRRLVKSRFESGHSSGLNQDHSGIEFVRVRIVEFMEIRAFRQEEAYSSGEQNTNMVRAWVPGVLLLDFVGQFSEEVVSGCSLQYASAVSFNIYVIRNAGKQCVSI